MTGKEIQRTVSYGDEIDSESSKKIVWMIALTEDDIDRLAQEIGYADALNGDNRDDYLRKIKNESSVQRSLEKKMRRKARQTIKKYLPADEREVASDESYSFLGCDFPDQMD